MFALFCIALYTEFVMWQITTVAAPLEFATMCVFRIQ